MSVWYDSLKKPQFTPPNKAFWPVWATIYLFVFVALALYFLSPYKPYFSASIALLIIHFTAGFSWTGIFFNRKKILLAFFDILIIDITLISIILLFLQSSIPAALLLLPYLSWGLFATYLNWMFYQLNR
jgi:tryptophan-rich sensory protein